LMFRPLTRD